MTTWLLNRSAQPVLQAVPPSTSDWRWTERLLATAVAVLSTLALVFLLTVFSAVAASFLLSGWLTGPLSMLAAGTRAVAEGDYRPRGLLGEHGRDIGGIVGGLHADENQLGNEGQAQGWASV